VALVAKCGDSIVMGFDAHSFSVTKLVAMSRNNVVSVSMAETAEAVGRIVEGIKQFSIAVVHKTESVFRCAVYGTTMCFKKASPAAGLLSISERDLTPMLVQIYALAEDSSMMLSKERA